MARKLAISTQLKEAAKKIEGLEKDLKQQKDYVAMYQKKSADAEALVEQLHQVLDAVPNPIARKSDGEESWSRIERSPVTRMAAWLAGLGSARSF